MKEQQIKEQLGRIKRLYIVVRFLDKLIYFSEPQVLPLSDIIILIRPSSPSCCQNDVMDVKALYKL